MRKPGPTSTGYAGKIHDPSDPGLTRYGMLGGPLLPDDPCVACGHSTVFGSGRFPNRVSTETGYMCQECVSNGQ